MADEFTIRDLPSVPNIASILDEAKLAEIARRCIDGFKIDKESRSDREEEWEKADDAFKLKREDKSYPFRNAANVKYPALLQAAVDFQSRAMPAIIHQGKVFKSKTIGQDEQGAKAGQGTRVAEYMNWQVLERDDQWIADTDKMALQLPIYGNAFKKLYNDPVRGNVSELVCCKDLVVNNAAPSLDRAPRITQMFDLYPYEIEERKRDGRYLEDFDVDAASPSAQSTEDSEPKESNVTGGDGQQDEQQPHEFLEQHCFYDMDEDGYPEPYIVTLHRGMEKVVRIVAAFTLNDVLINDKKEVAKIVHKPMYVKYGFIPDPEGGFYDIGFGALLHDPVNIVNSLINQIIDAGSLQNSSGGFIGREFRLKAGEYRQELGVWKQVPFAGDDIRKAIVPFDHRGPSAVLFEMLGFMVDLTKQLTAQRDVLSGDAPAGQPASTTLALIEQGLKVFTGIIGRVLRALSAEGQTLFELNSRYQNPQEYMNVGDGTGYQAMPEDFNIGANNIAPVADAAIVTDLQRMARAEMLMQLREDPMINAQEVLKRYLEAAGVETENLIVPPQPDPMQQIAAQTELENTQADTAKKQAGAMKDVASIEQENRKIEIDEAQKTVDALRTFGELQMKVNDAENEPGELRGMAGQSGDGGIPVNIDDILENLGGYDQNADVGGGFPYPGTSGGFVQ